MITIANKTFDHFIPIGYAFVVYSKPSEARECIKTLNNYEIRKGRYLGVCISVDNCRLFVGGIPKRAQKDEVIAEISKVTEGVVDVIMYPSASDKTKNRGFAFIEYECHRAAAMARRKLMSGGIQLWGHQIAVDWAEPEIEPDEEIMSQVCYNVHNSFSIIRVDLLYVVILMTGLLYQHLSVYSIPLA